MSEPQLPISPSAGPHDLRDNLLRYYASGAVVASSLVLLGPVFDSLKRVLGSADGLSAGVAAVVTVLVITVVPVLGLLAQQCYFAVDASYIRSVERRANLKRLKELVTADSQEQSDEVIRRSWEYWIYALANPRVLDRSKYLSGLRTALGAMLAASIVALVVAVVWVVLRFWLAVTTGGPGLTAVVVGLVVYAVLVGVFSLAVVRGRQNFEDFELAVLGVHAQDILAVIATQRSSQDSRSPASGQSEASVADNGRLGETGAPPEPGPAAEEPA